MIKFIRSIFFIITLLLSHPSYSLEVNSDIPENPNSALIMIHGWRQDGKSMQWFTSKLNKDFPDMAFYYPTAPDKADRGGYEWFVIPALGEKISKMEIYQIMMSSALKNINELHKLIDEIHTTQGIEYKNIHIAGFSQGGLMSLLVGLTNNKLIGKVISFSGVPLLFTEDFTSKNINSRPEILIIQGDNDYIIPVDSYNITHETLKSIDIMSNLQVIKNMPHIINDKAIEHTIDFLKK